MKISFVLFSTWRLYQKKIERNRRKYILQAQRGLYGRQKPLTKVGILIVWKKNRNDFGNSKFFYVILSSLHQELIYSPRVNVENISRTVIIRLNIYMYHKVGIIMWQSPWSKYWMRSKNRGLVKEISVFYCTSHMCFSSKRASEHDEWYK